MCAWERMYHLCSDQSHAGQQAMLHEFLTCHFLSFLAVLTMQRGWKSNVTKLRRLRENFVSALVRYEMQQVLSGESTSSTSEVPSGLVRKETVPSTPGVPPLNLRPHVPL